MLGLEDFENEPEEIHIIPPYRGLALALANELTIRAAFREAHQRAHDLRSRLRELELQMGQARRLLSTLPPPSWPPLPGPVRPPTLHEAIQLVLEANDNTWMNISIVTTEIAQRRLYRRRDGFAASAKDVSARVRTYRYLFEIDGYAVRMRTPRVDRSPL